MEEKKIKIIGMIAIMIVLLNLMLFSFNIINWWIFLLVLALGYAFIKIGLPRLRK